MNSPLPIQEYRFTFHAVDAIPMRRDCGSAWRGVFGTALKRTACVTRLRECKGCLLLHSCAYAYLLETPIPPATQKMRRYDQAPHPYALLPEITGQDRTLEPQERFFVDMRLFGNGSRSLPFVVQAWNQAGGLGFGRGRARFALLEAAQRPNLGSAQWQSIYRRDQPRIEPITTCPPELPPAPDRVRVEIATPLRVMRDNKPVSPEKIRFRDLFDPLLRRFSMLSYFHTDAPLDADFRHLNDLAGKVALEAPRLHWHRWQRWSNRQKKPIDMSGVRGAFELAGGDLGELWPYLWFGQWIGAGKGTVMGMGRYRVCGQTNGVDERKNCQSGAPTTSEENV